jgi:hypothetical protein
MADVVAQGIGPEFKTQYHKKNSSITFILLHPLHSPYSLPQVSTSSWDLFYSPVLHVVYKTYLKHFIAIYIL